MLGIHGQQPSIGGDDLGGQQVVDRQAEAPDQVADAAAQGDAADADRPGVAEADRQAVFRGCRGHLAGGEPGLGPCRPPLDVDVQLAHVAQVDHDSAVADPVAGVRVTATAHGERQAGLAGELDRPLDIGCIGDPHDERRMAVDAADEDSPRRVVAGVARTDHLARQFGAQLVDGDRGRRGRHVDLRGSAFRYVVRWGRTRPGRGTHRLGS